MPTKLVYHEQGELYEHKATVTSIQPLEPPTDVKPSDTPADSHVIHLNETIFHVQGGGQPFDLGTITTAFTSSPTDTHGTANGTSDPITFNITSVRTGEGDTVRHTGHFLPSTATFQPNIPVHLSIDIPRRVLNSRIHSAGHILGVAIMRLSRAGTLPHLVETKAKHYPDDASVEFQGLIDGKFKEIIQKTTDELVAEGRPLHIRFWSRKECEAQGVAVPEGKVGGPEGEEVFRAVEIEGCGAYACGGTHVRDTKGVGRVVVRSIRRQKGGTRVGYFVEETKD